MMEAVARVEQRPARVRLLELGREYDALRDEILEACDRVLSGGRLLGGTELPAFEAEMATYLGVSETRGVASGTDALRLALRAAGVGHGAEVLIQANAFVAAVEAIHDVGARPVPVDVRDDDLGPDPEELAAAIGPRTRAVLVVHLYGWPVDVVPVLALARAHDLVVVEDCSHAHGATLDGRRVGGFGMAGAFSLGVVKNLAAYGDAGLVSTNDAELARRVTLLGTHGQTRKNEHSLYGGNSRLDELQAAMLRVKLRRLDARNARRAEVAAFYDERFGHLVVPPPSDPRRTSVHHQYVVRTTERAALQAHLHELGIDAGVHYPVPIHRQPAWRATFGEAPRLPRVERAADELLSLPVHPDLTDTEVERVTDAVRAFFA